MTWRRRRRFLARSALGLFLLLGLPVAGQSPYAQFPSMNSGRTDRDSPDSKDPFDRDPSQEEKRLRMLNAARQKSIVTETEKLLRLAKELNDEVSTSDSASMTDAQLRKVAEIGKLARSVKEKMSFSVGSYPKVSPPITINPTIP